MPNGKFSLHVQKALKAAYYFLPQTICFGDLVTVSLLCGEFVSKIINADSTTSYICLQQSKHIS